MFADYLERFVISFEVPKITPFPSKTPPSELSKTKTPEVSK